MLNILYLMHNSSHRGVCKNESPQKRYNTTRPPVYQYHQYFVREDKPLMVLYSLVALVVRRRPASISLQLPRSKKKIWTDWMASIERSLVLGRWEPSSNQKGQKWDVFENWSRSLPQYKSNLQRSEKFNHSNHDLTGKAVVSLRLSVLQTNSSKIVQEEAGTNSS